VRYFIEFAYKGTHFNGLASQTVGKVRTVQQELDKAFATITKNEITSTTSSRTDAGVHALQNYIHIDVDFEFTDKHCYQLNAILPHDIWLKRIAPVANDAHCRFDATHRRYEYKLSLRKNPFANDTTWHYPFALDLEAMQECAQYLLTVQDFETFCKKHTDVYTFLCDLQISKWNVDLENDILCYKVQANRFLRGMVRALVATMLEVGRGKITTERFRQIVTSKDNTAASFAAPAHGLCLMEVAFLYL
jgi:tRNA pseudouridine38-40 synthase